MMKPTNIKSTSYHTSKSSNQVIWDGPDIPCIDLCKGATITNAVYEIAQQVCRLVEETDPANYNLECLDLESCESITFPQLFQKMIDIVFCDGITPGPTPEPENCCDDLPFIPQTVLYAEELELTEIGELEDTTLAFTEYTVPAGGGTYEVLFNATAVASTVGDTLTSYIDTFVVVNGSPLPLKRRHLTPNIEHITSFLYNSMTLFKSNIELEEGDVIEIGYETSSDFDGGLEDKVIKITKIA